MPLGFRGPLANTRQAQYTLLRQRAFLQQIVHQTTHSLARFFLEVDANYKQFKTGPGAEAAEQRLAAAQAFYEEGRITIDRYLDAVSQLAQAVAQEAQFKTTYNTSIAALEEAKGTLLAYDNIARGRGAAPAEGVHPGPRPAGRAPAVPRPARRPVPPQADQRPARCRIGPRRWPPRARPRPARGPRCRPPWARSARRRPRPRRWSRPASTAP